MAKMIVMPNQAIIDGFKGKIDFYFWKGIPVARKWPRSPGGLRAPAVQAAWVDFVYSARAWKTLDPTIQRAYEVLATGSGLTGRDMFTRSYLTGLFRYPHSRPTELSTIYWKDASVEVLSDLARTVATGWLEKDITIHTSPIAKFAILELDFLCSACGTAGLSTFNVKKGGTAPAYVARIATSFNEADGVHKHQQVILALDDTQMFEYELTPATNATISAWLWLLGYIE